jgi:hypothetical protein
MEAQMNTRTNGVANGVANGNGAAGAAHRAFPTRARPAGARVGHAVVHTATVDVQVLRLDRRQMTLAVFRQLPERDIFRGGDGTPVLLGRPWGRVLYTWGGSPEWADYYLVWQGGDRLYRMPLPLADRLKKPVGRLGLAKGYGFFGRLGLDWVWLGYEGDCNDEALASYEEHLDRLEAFEGLPQLFIAV